MIQTREELRDFINCDKARYGSRKPAILGWFFGDEGYVVKKYLNTLRHLEYYTNKRKNPLDYIPYVYYFFRHRRMSLVTGIHIGVNKVGKGLYIPHFKGGVIVNCKKWAIIVS